MGTPVFKCRMCGQCCEGAGGIVVSPKDLERLSDYLHMQADACAKRYCYEQYGKLKLRSNPEGFCIFFEQGKGCVVHEGKPAICRAWPFFRGNMVDSESLFMAKEYCPGIRQDVAHEEFVLEGKQYLTSHCLSASNAREEAHALIPSYSVKH